MSTSLPVPPLKIGMVAGEASGDQLGAALVREIKKVVPRAHCFGIGGPAMVAEGFVSEVDMERLSVNGFIDPLMRLPELIRGLLLMRDKVIASQATCFVGIDFNGFNLLLAGLLHRRGIKTVHYVSPSVWAWRRRRLKKIAKNIDLMLTLYPHETQLYEQHHIPVAFVGHPMADEISYEEATSQRDQHKTNARAQLGIAPGARVVAILPGSRAREVNYSGRDFLQTAEYLSQEVDWFVIPAANVKRRRQLEAMLGDYPAVAGRVQLVDGQVRQAIKAADLVLVNSGTATLEALLLRRPMIMSYRLGALTYTIVSRLVYSKWFALPNILAGRQLVPEFIQQDADPRRMAAAATELLLAPDHSDLLDEFARIHRQLITNKAPGRAAAQALLALCGVADA